MTDSADNRQNADPRPADAVTFANIVGPDVIDARQ
jgi:hypothetical protein